MRIVVSGADGFLGSHVLERLRQEGGHRVVGLTLYPEMLRSRFEDWDELTVVAADLRVMEEDSALNDADIYLACAFPRATGAEGLAEGLDFVYGALGLMLDKGCKAVVNISSQSVYDPHRTSPAKESDSVLLTSTYAATKYCVERSVGQMCHDKGVPFTSVRMASLIGPDFNQRFVNKMVCCAIETGVVTVIDNGSRFGFLDVEDAAEGLLRLMLSKAEAWDACYNLGQPSSYTTTEVASVVAIAVSESVRSCEVVESTRHCETEITPIDSSVDSSRFADAMGWSPLLSIKDSVYKILSSIRARAATMSEHNE